MPVKRALKALLDHYLLNHCFSSTIDPKIHEGGRPLTITSLLKFLLKQLMSVALIFGELADIQSFMDFSALLMVFFNTRL